MHTLRQFVVGLQLLLILRQDGGLCYLTILTAELISCERLVCFTNYEVC